MMFDHFWQTTLAKNAETKNCQALMALQGHGLTVEETDLKRAETLGDMTRREPVRPFWLCFAGRFGGFWPKKVEAKWSPGRFFNTKLNSTDKRSWKMTTLISGSVGCGELESEEVNQLAWFLADKPGDLEHLLFSIPLRFLSRVIAMGSAASVPDEAKKMKEKELEEPRLKPNMVIFINQKWSFFPWTNW